MAAIGNAVADAIGRPLNEMPISPWRLLRAVGREQDREDDEA